MHFKVFSQEDKKDDESCRLNNEVRAERARDVQCLLRLFSSTPKPSIYLWW